MTVDDDPVADEDSVVEPVSALRSGAHLDRLADLEEDRRFLLGSLTDLEREHDAGDVDDAHAVIALPLQHGQCGYLEACPRALASGAASLRRGARFYGLF